MPEKTDEKQKEAVAFRDAIRALLAELWKRGCGQRLRKLFEKHPGLVVQALDPSLRPSVEEEEVLPSEVREALLEYLAGARRGDERVGSQGRPLRAHRSGPRHAETVPVTRTLRYNQVNIPVHSDASPWGKKERPSAHLIGRLARLFADRGGRRDMAFAAVLKKLYVHFNVSRFEEWRPFILQNYDESLRNREANRLGKLRAGAEDREHYRRERRELARQNVFVSQSYFVNQTLRMIDKAPKKAVILLVTLLGGLKGGLVARGAMGAYDHMSALEDEGVPPGKAAAAGVLGGAFDAATSFLLGAAIKELGTDHLITQQLIKHTFGTMVKEAVHEELEEAFEEALAKQGVGDRVEDDISRLGRAVSDLELTFHKKMDALEARQRNRGHAIADLENRVEVIAP